MKSVDNAKIISGIQKLYSVYGEDDDSIQKAYEYAQKSHQ